MKHAVGCILIAAGLLWLTVFALMTMGLGGLYSGRGEDITQRISPMGIIGPFVVGSALLVGGMVLREGRKYSVLFLRPFRSIANEKAMRAFSRRLGRRFTVVALDDGVIPPPERSILRMLVSVFVLAPVSLMLFFVGALVTPMGNRGVANSIPAIVVLSVAMLVARAAWGGMRQPRDRSSVATPWALQQAILKIRALSTWGLRALSPSVVIVKATNDLWPTAVIEIGKVTDLALIDVSRYSGNIEWEIGFLRASKATRSLVIAALESPPPPQECSFAGGVEMYSRSLESDIDFEKRIRGRLEALVR